MSPTGNFRSRSLRIQSLPQLCIRKICDNKREEEEEEVAF